MNDSLCNEARGERTGTTKVDKTRIWWVQAEAVVGFYNEYQKHGSSPFKDAAERVFKYLENYVVDKRPGREWFGDLNEDGTPLANQESIDLDFGPDDPYKVVNLSVNTSAVSALQEADEEAEYVMAFRLFSAGKVSADINFILLKPDIEVPMIGLLSPGEEPHKFTSASQTSDTYTNTLSLNMDENRWDFTCTMEVMDKAWLQEYNLTYAKQYELLPASFYTIPEQEIRFAEGITEATFKVTVTREGMEMLKEYALPIVLTSCSKPEFKID